MTEFFSPNHSLYGIKENVQRFQSGKADIYGYLYTNKSGNPCATVFPKKGKKPILHCRYGNTEQRVESVERVITNRISHKKEVAKRRKENSQTTLKAGDVLYTSWGYDQTNVDFFKVLEVVGKKKVKLVEIAQQRVEGSGEDNGMSCKVTAMPEKEIGPVFYKMASKDAVKISRCQTAWKWDGSDKYKSWYA